MHVARGTAPEPTALADAGTALIGIAQHAQLPYDVLRRARDLRLLPAADAAEGCWSAQAVQQIVSTWPQIVTAVTKSEEFGGVRCAELLARLTGLAITPGHLELLSARGLLRPCRHHRGQPLYLVGDVQELVGDQLRRALLGAIATG